MSRCRHCFKRIAIDDIHVCPAATPTSEQPRRRGRPPLSDEERQRRQAARPAKAPERRGRAPSFADATLEEAVALHDGGLTWRQAGERLGVDWNKLRYALDHRLRQRGTERPSRTGAQRGGRPPTFEEELLAQARYLRSLGVPWAGIAELLGVPAQRTNSLTRATRNVRQRALYAQGPPSGGTCRKCGEELPAGRKLRLCTWCANEYKVEYRARGAA